MSILILYLYYLSYIDIKSIYFRKERQVPKVPDFNDPLYARTVTEVYHNETRFRKENTPLKKGEWFELQFDKRFNTRPSESTFEGMYIFESLLIIKMIIF